MRHRDTTMPCVHQVTAAEEALDRLVGHLQYESLGICEDGSSDW